LIFVGFGENKLVYTNTLYVQRVFCTKALNLGTRLKCAISTIHNMWQAAAWMPSRVT